jgi:serine protease Do
MTRQLRWAGLALVLAALGPDDAGRDEQIGQAFQVPYRLTLTNHYLVRARINGKGPFNFLVDTGAPALYVGTKAARAIGLEPQKNEFWTPVDRLDLEGGAILRDLKARVEDPYQLEGMNALGLPGATIDGILGFTVLGRFRMEFDPTRDRMTWTRLDYVPKDPPVPRRGTNAVPPPEMQGMNALGALAKVFALFSGRQPEDILRPRGLLGIELAESDGIVRVSGLLADSPASKSGVKVGDRLVRINDRTSDDLDAVHAAAAKIQPGDRVDLTVRRGPGTLTIQLKAIEGL